MQGFASLYQLAVVMQQGLLQAGADHVIWRCKYRHDSEESVHAEYFC